MARQKGIIRLTGTMGGKTYYKRGDKYFARKKTSLNKKRLKTDPAFVSTMAYSKEFGQVAHTGKNLRRAVSFLCAEATRKKAMIKLNKVLLKIKKLDTVSVLGERNVFNGLKTAEAGKMLEGFSFHAKNSLSHLFYRQVIICGEQNMFSIQNVVPMRDFCSPKGSTHVQLQGCLLLLDKKGECTLGKTESLVLKLDAKVTDVQLKASLPKGPGLVLYVLGIKFLQAGANGEMEERGQGFAGITAVEPLEATGEKKVLQRSNDQPKLPGERPVHLHKRDGQPQPMEKVNLAETRDMPAAVFYAAAAHRQVRPAERFAYSRIQARVRTPHVFPGFRPGGDRHFQQRCSIAQPKWFDRLEVLRKQGSGRRAAPA